MAITAYTGLPGSGKSYGVVENVIVPSLKEGRKVFTNIPINEHEFDGCLVQFAITDLEENPAWFQEVFEAGAICIIDEVWRLWPSGLKANRIEQGHKSFLAEHRHMVGVTGKSTDIVLVTQDLSQIAAYPRSLIENTYRSVKLTAVGQDSRYRIDVYQGGVTGPQPPERLKLRSMYGKYKPEIFALYQSQTMSSAAEHGDESRIDTRANLLNDAFVKYGVPLSLLGALVVVMLGFSAFGSLFGDTEDGEIQTEPQVVMANAIQPDALAAPIQPMVSFDKYISLNLGRLPNIYYAVTFTKDNAHFSLTATQLRTLGYLVEGIAPCLLRLEFSGQVEFVTCLDDEPQQDSSLIAFAE